MTAFRVIQIVDNIDPVNLGVWQAAISTAKALAEQHDIETELWYPMSVNRGLDTSGFVARSLDDVTNDALSIAVKESKIEPKNTLIQTHGVWQFPTDWGQKLAKQGFQWIACPQGMLEPWSMSQKRLKKLIYSRLIEFPKLKKANAIRAVSKPESENLKKLFPRQKIKLIPNGICIDTSIPPNVAFEPPIRFLFLGRLHPKKGIAPLVDAWTTSGFSTRDDCQLTIAGPDQGEWKKIETQVNAAKNIDYVGSKYGEEKESLFQGSHYYILPTFSEGFPSSTIEAINHGLVPITTDGCNFPELFERGLGIKISTDPQSIETGLNHALNMDASMFSNQRELTMAFVRNEYSLDQIAAQQATLYRELLR